MSVPYYDVYDGSEIFAFLGDELGVPIDLMNFVISQIAALWLATLFRKQLRKASPEVRHSVCLAFGLIIGYFCFGKQAIHLVVLPMLVYTLLKTIPHHCMGNVILAASMLYLSCLHIHRQIYHTANYSLTITGPMMAITQRVTSLAYSLQDGLLGKTVNPNTAGDTKGFTTIFERIPSPLEYFAYTLTFQTLICGTVVFYSDYMRFIQGSLVRGGKKTVLEVTPSPRNVVFWKATASFLAAFLYMSLYFEFPLSVVNQLRDPQSEVSRTWSALYLLWYTYLSTLIDHLRYYHFWLLSDAICNNSGMGFNGYTPEGQPKWDKLSNIDIFEFEFSQNLRTATANWNKNTHRWLRGVAYDRGGNAFRIARVFALSAVWHGFYPGYYFTFVTGGIFTVAARKMRSVLRPKFLDSGLKKRFYDILTFFATRVAWTYVYIPFILRHLTPSLAYYGKFYYSLHLIAIGICFIPENSKRSSSQQTIELPESFKVNRETETNGKLRLKIDTGS